MSEDVKLEPCPFCGGEARVRPDCYEEAWTPECTNADCHVGYLDFPWFHDKADALAAWNRRAYPATLVRDVVKATLDKASWRIVWTGGLGDLDGLADEFAAEIVAEQNAKPAVGPATRAVMTGVLLKWLEQSTRGLDDAAPITIDGKASVAVRCIRQAIAEQNAKP